MASLNGFDATTVDTSNTIPAGLYTVAIIDSDYRQTKAGTGHYLKLELEILEGDQKGRKLWDNLNLDNPNPTAVRMANQSLAQICMAIGIPRPNDSEELHNKPMLASVLVKDNPQYGKENAIELYGELPGGAPAPQAAAMPPDVAASMAFQAPAPDPKSDPIPF